MHHTRTHTPGTPSSGTAAPLFAHIRKPALSFVHAPPMNCRDHAVRVAQACLGLALALCEDGPMAGISMYFFVQRDQIPVFQVRRPCSSDIRFTLAAAVHWNPELIFAYAGAGHQPVYLGRHAWAQARASHRAAGDVGQAVEVALKGAASVRGS
jgi:hypothetical protein